MQDRMEESIRTEIYPLDDVEHISIRAKELLNYRKQIEEREKQLDAYRAQLKSEQLAREKELQNELEARERFFAEREKKFFERQKEFEKTLLNRQTEMEVLRARLEHEIVRRESELHEMQRALQTQQEIYTEESRKKIERTSKDYVSEALELLRTKEVEFHNRSKTWGIIGATSLLGGVFFFGYVTITSFAIIPNPVSWEFITFSVFKGLIAVALFAALAKYSLLFSKSYMREALKNADRRHAINFGKFYLESYGAAADWTQIKEAFEHWNIMGDNAFSTNFSSKFDVTTLEHVAAAVEKIRKLLPTISNEKGA